MPTSDDDYSWPTGSEVLGPRHADGTRRSQHFRGENKLFYDLFPEVADAIKGKRRRKRKKARKHDPLGREFDVARLKPRFRQRVVPLKTGHLGRLQTTLDGPNNVLHRIDFDIPTRPVLTGTGDGGALVEHCWDHIHPGPPFLSGGPFRLLRIRSPWDDVQGFTHVDDGPGLKREYDGGFVPSYMGPDQIDDVYVRLAGMDSPMYPDHQLGSDYGDPSYYGAEGWNKFRPKYEAMEGLVSLWETKDLPGMIEQARSAAKGFHQSWKSLGGARKFFGPRNAGSLFLQSEFGWKPFVSDLIKLHDTYTNLDRDLDQVVKNNGSWVRRHGTVLTENTLGSWVRDHSIRQAWAFPWLYGQLYRSVYDPVRDGYVEGYSEFSRTLQREVTFSGKFYQYVPLFDRSRYTADQWEANRVWRELRRFGVRVSPSVVYKAFPWSWLGNYFSNAGAVVDNLSATFLDSQISSYAYIMERRLTWASHHAKIFLRDQDVDCYWSQHVNSKRRVEASPYGFNLRPDQLSAKQQLILLSIAANGGGGSRSGSR